VCKLTTLARPRMPAVVSLLCISGPVLTTRAERHAQARLHVMGQILHVYQQHSVCSSTQAVIMHAEAMFPLLQSISLPKLAGLLEMDGSMLRSQLMLLKSTALVKTWNGSGDGTEVQTVRESSAPCQADNQLWLCHQAALHNLHDGFVAGCCIQLRPNYVRCPC
jgi:hypothetical protein